MIERKCVATQTIKPVSQLFRVVKTNEGKIFVEKDKKILGRGAYISKDLKSILLAQKKNLLSKALRCSIKDEVYLELISLLEGGNNNGKK